MGTLLFGDSKAKRLAFDMLGDGSFPEDIIGRYCGADRALVTTVAEMCMMGVSVREVEEGLQSLR